MSNRKCRDGESTTKSEKYNDADESVKEAEKAVTRTEKHSESKKKITE